MTPTDDEPIRGVIRLSSVRRVSHGLGVRKREGLTTDQEMWRDLRAYLEVLPPDAVFTHLTGAWLRGWHLPKLPEQVPVFVAVGSGQPRPRRAGLVCSRLARDHEPVLRSGLPVDRSEEILLRAARDLGMLDLLVLIESALQLDDLDHDRMAVLLATSRPGVRMLRAAWQRATGKSESPGETVLQEFHRAMGIPFEPQVELYDQHGTFFGRVDLLVTGTSFVHEYDGEHHRRRGQQKVDLRRERGLTGSSFVRKGFVLDDLLNQPATVMHELDRALGRSHQLSRLRRWKRLVGNSLYSEEGRDRILNRWRRQHGIVDWSGSA